MREDGRSVSPLLEVVEQDVMEKTVDVSLSEQINMIEPPLKPYIQGHVQEQACVKVDESEKEQVIENPQALREKKVRKGLKRLHELVVRVKQRFRCQAFYETKLESLRN